MELSGLLVIKTYDAACPEGSTWDGGVEDVDSGFGDGAFVGILLAERDG